MASFFSIFRKKEIEKKESEARILIAESTHNQAVMTPRNYQDLSEAGYQKNVIAYACVNKIASAVKSVRFLLFQNPTIRGGQRVELEQHPLIDLLKRPNPMMAGPSYWKTVASYMQLSGNSYSHWSGPDNGPPKEIWPLRPDRMKVIPGRLGLPSAYEYSVSGRTTQFSMDQSGLTAGKVLHIKTFHPLNDWYGMSPIEAAAFSIDQHNHAGAWNVSLLQNQARPSGILVVKDKLKDQEKAHLKRQMDEKYTGQRNAGKIMVINGSDAEWKSLSFAPKDMEWINSKHTSARDVALAFGVPPQLLGIPGDNTFSNYKEAKEAFWVETVIPLLEDLLAEHNNWLPTLFKDPRLFISYDKDELEALQPSRNAVWDRLGTAEYLTINEKRAAVGYDEREEAEANEILINSGKIPLTFDIDDFDEEAALTDERGVSEDEKSVTEFKVFVRNKRDRRKLWQSVNRKRGSHERRFATQLNTALRAQGQKVAEAVEGLPQDAALVAATHAIADNSDILDQVMRSNMKRVAEDFGSSVLRALKSEGLVYEVKDSQSQFESFLRNWLEENAAKNITQINDTTRRKVRDLIFETFQEGETEGRIGAVELGKRIEQKIKGLSKQRALLIARTETLTASMAASEAAARATNLPNLKKKWISSNDARSRDTHRSMDGVTVDINEKFEVRGKFGVDQMDRPGDNSAPVSQIANCRCALGYESGGSDD